MSFDLHLQLTGLCALVPSEPITTHPAPPAQPVPLPLPLTLSSLRVLLPDVRTPTPTHIGPHKICKHEPVLRVEQPNGTFQELDLGGDDIEILTVDTGQPGVELRPTYSFVANLARVRPSFQVDSRLFAQPIGRNDIVARLEVTAAKAFGVNPKPQTLSFNTTPPYTGNFAEAVRLEIRIAGKQGTFQLTSQRDATVVRTISFGPKPDGTPVQAVLSNLCDGVTIEPGDADFAAFYTLERRLKGPFLVPEPVINRGEVLASATQDGTCVPASTTKFP